MANRLCSPPRIRTQPIRESQTESSLQRLGISARFRHEPSASRLKLMRPKGRCRVTAAIGRPTAGVRPPACVGRRHVSPVRRSRTGLSQDLGRAHSHRSFAELIDERIDVVARIGALRDSDQWSQAGRQLSHYRSPRPTISKPWHAFVHEDLLSHECLLYRSSGGCHGGSGVRAMRCLRAALPVRCGSSLQLTCPLRADAPRARRQGN